jgi:hypothetical protein
MASVSPKRPQEMKFRCPQLRDKRRPQSASFRSTRPVPKRVTGQHRLCPRPGSIGDWLTGIGSLHLSHEGQTNHGSERRRHPGHDCWVDPIQPPLHSPWYRGGDAIRTEPTEQEKYLAKATPMLRDVATPGLERNLNSLNSCDGRVFHGEFLRQKSYVGRRMVQMKKALAGGLILQSANRPRWKQNDPVSFSVLKYLGSNQTEFKVPKCQHQRRKGSWPTKVN